MLTPFPGPGGRIRVSTEFDVRLGRPPIAGYLGYMYDVSPDGQRVLVNTAVGDDTTVSAISLVINWPAALPQ